MSACLPCVVLWLVAAWAGFGVQGFIAAAILGMWRLGTRERWQSETSAYSVFNAGGARIAGTLTAEQIDGQLRNGGHAASGGGAQGSGQAHGHWWGGGRTLSAAAAAAEPASEPKAVREQRAAAAAMAAEARARRRVEAE